MSASSATAPGQTPTISLPTTPSPALQSLLNFTPADLAANQAGRLTAAQEAHLYRELRVNWIIFGVAAVLFVTVAVVAFIADIPSAAIFFGGMGILLLSVFYWSLHRQSKRLHAGAIHVRQGELTLSSERRRRAGTAAGRNVYWMTIDGKRFPIEHELYMELKQALATGNALYTLYFLAGEEKILSMVEGVEPVTMQGNADTGMPGYQVAGRTISPRSGSIRGGQAANREVRQAIDILEGKRSPEPSETDPEAAARATLLAAGPAIVPVLVPFLHKPLYQELVAQMGDEAIGPLMRALAQEGHLVESRLLNHVVGTLNTMPLEALADSLPPYMGGHHPPAVRMAAVRSLGNRRNPQRLRFLQSASHDPEPAIAAHAQQTLARVANLNGWG